MQTANLPVSSLPLAERQARARAFVQTAKWSVLIMRGGRALDSQGNRSRVTLRVFVKGCPAPILREVLQVLGERAEEPQIIAGGQAQGGPWYHKAAWWARDAQTQESGDATLTLIRELSDGPVTETNVIEDGCGSKTQIRYVFDAVAVESVSDIAEYGTQGFSVKLGGISRDPETQLVSYYVAVTERKTLLMPEDIVSTDAFSTEYDASWLGLRGTSEAPVDSDGEGVSVWDPAVQAIGELITTQWAKNAEDCTLDARGRKSVAKRNVEAGSSCARTAFAETDTWRVKGAEHGLGHAPAAADGVSYEYDQELRKDNLYDTNKRKHTEFAVENARVTTEADAFGVETQVQHRSVADDPAAVTPGNGVSGGTTVEITEGRRKNTVRRLKTETEVVDAQVSEEKTVFSKKRRTTTKASRAAVPASEAGGGKGKAVAASTTPGKLKDVSVDEEEELFVGAAQVSELETAFESVYRYTDANSLADRPPATFADGVSVATTEQRKPLGSRDLGVTITVEKDVAEAERSASKTAYQAEASVASVSAGAAGAVPEAHDGLTQAIRDVLTPGGKHKKTLIQTQEIHVPNAGFQKTRTPLGTRITVSAANAPVGFDLGDNELGAVGNRQTPGKRWNAEKTSFADTIGAFGFHSYEDHYLLRTEVHKQIVSSFSGNESRLSGRTLTSDSFAATDGGHWERTRTIETVPPPRMFQITDKATSIMGGDLFTIAAVDTHVKMVLFLNSSIDAVATVANAFIASHPPFIRTGSVGLLSYYFSYAFDVNVGLRPDKFGTWSGMLSMSAELVNKLVGQTTEVG